MPQSVTSFTDAAFVAANGGSALLVLGGLALGSLAIGGIWRAVAVAKLLRPRGRIVLPIVGWQSPE